MACRLAVFVFCKTTPMPVTWPHAMFHSYSKPTNNNNTLVLWVNEYFTPTLNKKSALNKIKFKYMRLVIKT